MFNLVIITCGRYSTVQYSTVQYSNSTVQVQYSTVQYSTVQYSTVTVQYSYSTVQYGYSTVRLQLRLQYGYSYRM
jgi:hypothetical protein